MTDCKNLIPQTRTLIERKSERYLPENHLSKQALGLTTTGFPDQVRRLIASKPTICVSVAFVVGGILGWLTSRR